MDLSLKPANRHRAAGECGVSIPTILGNGRKVRSCNLSCVVLYWFRKGRNDLTRVLSETAVYVL